MRSGRETHHGRSLSWLSRGDAMRTWPILGVLLVIGIGFGIVRPALGDGWKHERGQGQWWHGEWKDEFWDGPCQVKVGTKRDAYKEAVTCDRDD
jgi:hypothetical protein